MKLKKNKIFLGVGLVTFILLTLFIVNKPNAKPLNTNIDESKTINKDNNSIAMYIIDGEEETKIDQIPDGNYVLNDKSYCKTKDIEKDSSIDISFENNKINVNGITKKGTKCYIYFEKSSIKDDILAKYPSNGKIDEFTGIADTDEGIWEADDEMYGGTSYYYRGAVENNYVKFANFYWRIIRINGDGSIRLIYDGTKAYENGVSNEDRVIGFQKFNDLNTSAEDVGFKYMGDEVHGTEDESVILGKDESDPTTLYGWYKANILDNNFDSYVDQNGLFCNDRNAFSRYNYMSWDEWKRDIGQDVGGAGQVGTYFGAAIRLSQQMQQATTPSLECFNEKDIFSKEGATKGNQSLKYPVGLITADELVFAGAFGWQSNQEYYLYTGQSYWTMSPYDITDSLFFAHVFIDESSSGLSYASTNDDPGVRPVINLKATTTFKAGGDGTIAHPYEVVTK